MTECPYELCTADVTVADVPSPPWGGPPSMVTRQHEIEHPILHGLCPGSLMHLPLDGPARSHLRSAAERDKEIIGRTIAEQARREDVRLTEQARQARERQTAPKPTTNWFGNGPGHSAGTFDRPAELPRRTPGEAYRRGTSSMASYDEIIGQINAAAITIGEALGELSQSHDAIEAGMATGTDASNRLAATLVTLESLAGQLTEIRGTSGSQSLTEAIGVAEQEAEELAAARQFAVNAIDNFAAASSRTETARDRIGGLSDLLGEVIARLSI